MPAQPPNSILAVDVGSVNTRALLVDVVDGAYRLVAQGRAATTLGAPTDDASIGVRGVLREMEAATNRQLLDSQERLIRPEQQEGIGVDYCLTTTSAGHPIRALLVGLYPQLDIAGLRRAIAPCFMQAVAEIHLQDGQGTHGRLNRIVHSRPQAVIVAGGRDGGARNALLDMLALAKKALSLLPLGSRPVVIYAGNNSLAPDVRDMLGLQVEVVIAPNIRRGDGSLSLDGLQSALAEVFDLRRRHLPGFQRLAAMSDSGILPTARGIETLTSYFSRLTGNHALAVDMGSARTLVSLAGASRVETALCHDIGLGHSAADTLQRVGEEAVAAWLPFHPDKGELEGYALKKGLRLSHTPLDMRERCLEYALLRAGLRHAISRLESAATPDLALVAGEALTGGQGALDMLLMADALEGVGVLQVKSDPHGALSALGGLAKVAPDAVVQLIDGGILPDAGWLIRLAGNAPMGETALKLRIKRENGESTQHDVAAGEVWHLPLPASESVELRIQARRGTSVAGKRRLSLRVNGGRGGLLFDARLNALDKAESQTERALLLLRWYAAVAGSDEAVAIPESWLAPPNTNHA